MSDNASDEEQQRQMQEIFICADVWLEVFAFIDPFELGHMMALISDRFDVLVDKHFKSRKWSLGMLQIFPATFGGAKIVNERSGEQLPIPQGPLPNKVTGFGHIGICYVDQTVIEFLQRIRRLFDSSGPAVSIYTSDNQSRSWEIIWKKIWPFVNDNICHFDLTPSQLDRLRLFSPALLRNCANLRSIHADRLHYPAFPAEDNAEASSRQAVAKWLLTRHGDGLPKMLSSPRSWSGMEGLKGAFVNASEPVNFIVRSAVDERHVVPFELKNKTGERLTFREMDKDDLLLVRCPIGREEAKWAKWEEEAIKLKWRFWSQWNHIIIDFEDCDIGDGMLDENDQDPSGPK